MNYLFPSSVLLIFCKAPVPGQVKTRLQPALSAEQAATVHIKLTRMTLARAFAKSLCPVWLYCYPDTEHPFFKRCAEQYPLNLAIQHGDDLGMRMLNACQAGLARYRHVLLIGCDCPSLTSADLETALTALQDGHDVVIGPAEDGGYVLIGLNAPQPMLFQDMIWGNDRVLPETRRRAKAAKLRIFELDLQWDVDELKDWQRFSTEMGNQARSTSC